MTAVAGVGIIKVPSAFTGVRFPDNDHKGSQVVNLENTVLEQYRDGWFVQSVKAFEGTTSVHYFELLNPVTGILVTGVGKVGKSLVMGWGYSNTLGSLYTLDEQDMEHTITSRIEVGSIPLSRGGSMVTHSFDNKQLLKPGDLAVCVQNAGDYFFKYQLVVENGGELKAVRGMDFGAYGLHDRNPVKLLAVEFTRGSPRNL